MKHKTKKARTGKKVGEEGLEGSPLGSHQVLDNEDINNQEEKKMREVQNSSCIKSMKVSYKLVTNSCG